MPEHLQGKNKFNSKCIHKLGNCGRPVNYKLSEISMDFINEGNAVWTK